MTVLAHGGTPGLIAETAIGAARRGCCSVPSGSGSGAGGPAVSVPRQAPMRDEE